MNKPEFILNYVLNNNPKNVKVAMTMKQKAIAIYESLNIYTDYSFSFGKHKGVDLKEVPEDYLTWLSSKRPLKKEKDNNLLCEELVRRGMEKGYASDNLAF